MPNTFVSQTTVVPIWGKVMTSKLLGELRDTAPRASVYPKPLQTIQPSSFALSLASFQASARNSDRVIGARGQQAFKSAFETVRVVQLALEAAGVEFTNGDQPGVRMKAR